MPLLAGLAQASFSSACGNTNSGKSIDTKTIKWNVAVYEIVPFDSINLVADTAYYSSILPLRFEYTPDEATKVEELMELNDSLLSAKGFAYQLVKYGRLGKVDLVIYPKTPVIQQNVAPTDISYLPDYEDNINVAFQFDDKKKWEEITSANIGKVIAFSVNGKIMSAPQVNMPNYSRVTAKRRNKNRSQNRLRL